MSLAEEKANDIIKLAKAFAWRNKRYCDLFPSIDDYISELQLCVLQGLSHYDEKLGSFSNYCYMRFRYCIILQFKKVHSLKRENEKYKLSLNANIAGSDDITLSDTIASDKLEDNLDEYLNDKLTLEYAKYLIAKYGSPDIKMYILEHKTRNEIAKERNISIQGVNLNIQKDFKRLKAVLEGAKVNKVYHIDEFPTYEESQTTEKCSKRTYFRRKSVYKKHKAALNKIYNK